MCPAVWSVFVNRVLSDITLFLENFFQKLYEWNMRLPLVASGIKVPVFSDFVYVPKRSSDRFFKCDYYKSVVLQTRFVACGWL